MWLLQVNSGVVIFHGMNVTLGMDCKFCICYPFHQL